MLRENAEDGPVIEDDVSEDMELSEAAEPRLFASDEEGRGEGEGEGDLNLNVEDGNGVKGGGSSYVSRDHRARVFKNASRSLMSEWRSFQAVTRCSSHVIRRPSRSSDSERSLRRWRSLSRANSVVSVSSIKSVSSGDKFLCVAASQDCYQFSVYVERDRVV